MAQKGTHTGTQAGNSPCEAKSGLGSHDADIALTGALDEKPIWAGLYEGIRDALFAPKLPALELTSAPAPVEDRMSVRTNPWAVGTSTVVNSGILVALLCAGLRATYDPHLKPTPGSHLDLSDMNIFAPRSASGLTGGGSGGSHDLIAPMEGRLPRFERTPLLPPQVLTVTQPKLAIDAAVAVEPDIGLPDNPTMPNIGVHESPNVRLASNGPGGAAGMGTSPNGGGMGPGKGIGYGPGGDQGAGNQIYTPGVGGVTAPIALFTPEAEFSDEARRQKYQGMCTIALIVDAHGMPQNPRVVRALGMGLDEKALEAVMRYKFKPAMKNGRPVAVAITVMVNFRLLY